MALEEIRVSMPRALRDRRARNANGTVRLSRCIKDRRRAPVLNLSASVNSEDRPDFSSSFKKRVLRGALESLGEFDSDLGGVSPDLVYVCATRWFARKHRRGGEQLLHRQVGR